MTALTIERARALLDIKVNGKQTVIGIFDTPIEAHQAYLTAKRHMHPMGTL